MAQSNVIYKGEEKKFSINIQAAGFDMDTDDFELEISTPKAGDSVKVVKTGSPDESGRWSNEDGSLVVFYEEREVTEPSDSSSSDSSDEPTTTTVKDWFGIVDTQYFTGKGELKVIGTAYVADTKAHDGIRKAIDIKTLGTLNNK
jgi:hypothetical protein